ncbi:MAG: glycosyltransferase family 4 protein [Nitrospirae bacterium]|nr:glycosyltransferase family 4 protein [Nitrospirota bacterium]
MYKMVFLNGRFLTQQISGVQRFALELVKALDKAIGTRICDYRFVLLSPRKTMHNLKLQNIEHKKIGYLSGHLWEQIELPIYVGTGPLINFFSAPLFKKNHVVTMHDASVFDMPSAYSKFFVFFYQNAFRIWGRRARNLITESDFSRNRLAYYCNIPADAFSIISGGHEHIIHVKSDDTVFERYNINRRKPYLLMLGSMNANKNFAGFISALEYLRGIEIAAIIVGGSNSRVFQKKYIPFSPSVKHIGHISDGEARALYENALCLVFPSFYEGFGLPPLEAMACGCPVIVSHVASLPEVCGNAVIYCDPYNSVDIAEKIKQVIDNPLLRERLRNEGLKHAQQFTWQKSAIQLIDLADKMLKQKEKN